MKPHNNSSTETPYNPPSNNSLIHHPNKNNLLKRLLSTLILIFLIAFAFFYFSQNIQDFKSLSVVNPICLIVLIALFIFSYFLISLVTKNLLKPLGVYLKNFEAFALSLVTGFYNLITPFRGGMAARAIYLKKKHLFSYTDFLATLAGMYVIVFLISGIIGLFSSWFIYNSVGVYNIIIIGIFSAVVLGMIFIILFSSYFPQLKGRWLGKISKVINGWNLIKKNKKVVLSVSFFSLIQLLLTALMLYLQFRVFGIEISYIGTLMLVCISSLGLLISITPGNLGVGEAIIVFSALTIGITPAESLSAALLGRAISFLVLFILGPIFSYKLLNNKPKKNAPQN